MVLHKAQQRDVDQSFRFQSRKTVVFFGLVRGNARSSCEPRVRSAPRVLTLFFTRALLSRVLREKNDCIAVSCTTGTNFSIWKGLCASLLQVKCCCGCCCCRRCCYFRKSDQLSKTTEESCVFTCWLSSLYLNTSVKALRNFSLKKLWMKGLKAMK